VHARRQGLGAITGTPRRRVAVRHDTLTSAADYGPKKRAVKPRVTRT
jgi:hypothetical protein